MPAIAHTVDRDGRIVPANGFKKPTPTTAIHNHGIWMHSVDRTDSANTFTGFLILGATIAIGFIILKFLV